MSLLPESLFEKFGKIFEPGQIIFCEYEPGNDFHFIQEGKVKITKTMGSTQKTLDVLEPGDIFGEMAILEEEPRSASAIAVDKVKTLNFTRANFETLMNGNPQLAYRLLIIYSNRIYDARRRLQILLLDDMQAKVADVFIMLSEKDLNYGHTNKFTLNITIEDVANWCGQPVNEVHKVISHFTKQGKLELFSDRIIVNNINDLIRMVSTKKKSLNR